MVRRVRCIGGGGGGVGIGEGVGELLGVCNTEAVGEIREDGSVGKRSNLKKILRTRKIMVMHSNERGECCLRTLVD